MIGPTPTRYRQLRKTDQFYRPLCDARKAQPARVLCTRCEVCGERNAPWGYNNRYYCGKHREEGERELAASNR